MTLISEQWLDLGWRFNPAELRNEHGEWTRTGEELHPEGADYDHPNPSRLVTTRGPYKRPEDHPFFRAHPVSPENIVGVYDRAPEGFRQQGMRWYADAHDLAKKIADGDADKGAGVLSAYSPQTAWPVNMFNATRAFELGRAIGPGEGMITKGMQKNAQEAMDGEPADVANSSSKTAAFARLIRNGGDMPDDRQGDVVIDRHAMSVAMGGRLPKKEAEKAPIGTPRYYDYVADQYREAALRISRRDGHPVAPHQVQAITWLQQQEENEDAYDLAGQKGSALDKGRTSMLRNAWNRWGRLASTEGIATVPGTTAFQAAGLISEQFLDLSFDPFQPRDSRGRWTKFGEVGQAVKVMEREREGFSVSPRTGEAPVSGYMVALDGHTHRYPAAILDDPQKLHRAIDDMLMSEREAFRGRDMYLGGWVEDGKLWLDPSQNIQDKAEAERLGRERDQVGIFDLQHFSTIDTGGSGGGRIIDHARQGPREDPRGLLGPAGGRAPGGSGEDRGGHQVWTEAIDLGWHDSWRHQLRDRRGRWTRLGGAPDTDIPTRFRHTAGRETPVSNVARDWMARHSGMVPQMYGPGTHEGWNGQLKTFRPEEEPGYDAFLDWDGTLKLNSDVASRLEESAVDPNAVVHADDYNIVLHELTHGVIPDGQTWQQHAQAYNSDLATANIEEGFTQLGAVQHLPEFIARLPHHREDLMQEARRVARPEHIKAGTGSGHYRQLASQAYNWVSLAARMRTGKGEGDPDTQRLIQDMSDDVNRQGPAGKAREMALHVMGDMLSGNQATDEAMLSSAEQSIKAEWNTGDAGRAMAAARMAGIRQAAMARAADRSAA